MSSPLYQTYSPTVIKTEKVDLHMEGKGLIRGPKPRKESSCYAWNSHVDFLCLVCKFDPFFEKEGRERKHPREADKCRNSIPYINYFIVSK